MVSGRMMVGRIDGRTSLMTGTMIVASLRSQVPSHLSDCWQQALRAHGRTRGQSAGESSHGKRSSPG